MYTDISDLQPHLSPYLPGCPDNLILQELRKAAREFFGQTEVWQQTEEDIDVVADQASYTLSFTTSGDTPQIRRIAWLKLSGVYADIDGYDLDGTTLTFQTNYIPSTAVTDGMDVRLVAVPFESHADYTGETVIDDWHEAIEAKALEKLLSIGNRPWTDIQLAASFRRRYNDQVSRAIRTRITGNKSGSLRAYGGSWL